MAILPVCALPVSLSTVFAIQKLEERLRSYSFSPGALRWLPLDSRAFGPPRRRAGAVDYFLNHAGSITEVYPKAPACPSHPVLLNQIAPAYFVNFRDTLPPAYVFSMSGARVLGSAGWIVGENDTLLVESSFWREPDFPQPFQSHFILNRKRAPALRHLPGRCLSLASDFAVGGFGHFLHDSLPRLHLVERAGHKLGNFDWLYLPRLDSSATRSLVAALDFPPERLLQYDARFDLAADELIATTFPGTPGNLPSYTPEFLRRRFTSQAAPAQRKIFLSREGFRRDLVNRPAIERLLVDRGFEICRPQEHDAIRACSEADVIVSQEGANFMNTLFAPPGTRVLMLLPDSGNNLPYAFTLAAAAGHKLFVQSCPLVDSTPGNEGTSPVVADLEVFALGLDQLLAAR